MDLINRDYESNVPVYIGQEIANKI